MDFSSSSAELGSFSPFWFMGAHGDKVQGFIVTPPNFDPNKKYPVKFIVHGGPEVAMGDEWTYRWNAELFAANGYVVIEINFHGSPGYGQKFIDAINGDWGGAPYEDLMKGLDYAEQHYSFIDKERECALGASFGGWMVNWIMGHANRFKCIVSHDGTFNTESDYGTTEELWFNEWEFKERHGRTLNFIASGLRICLRRISKRRHWWSTASSITVLTFPKDYSCLRLCSG
jgi:dipeptidyl aminopeptidase/acylaminoacyl peptidase